MFSFLRVSLFLFRPLVPKPRRIPLFFLPRENEWRHACYFVICGHDHPVNFGTNYVTEIPFGNRIRVFLSSHLYVYLNRLISSSTVLGIMTTRCTMVVIYSREKKKAKDYAHLQIYLCFCRFEGLILSRTYLKVTVRFFTELWLSRPSEAYCCCTLWLE